MVKIHLISIFGVLLPEINFLVSYKLKQLVNTLFAKIVLTVNLSLVSFAKRKGCAIRISFFPISTFKIFPKIYLSSFYLLRFSILYSTKAPALISSFQLLSLVSSFHLQFLAPISSFQLYSVLALAASFSLQLWLLALVQLWLLASSFSF